MSKELSQYNGRIAKIEGPARSGKTEILVQRCARLLEQGVDPASILVVASSQLACDRFRQRLKDALSTEYQERSSGVIVSRALDVCVSILDTPTARNVTERSPRILNESEYLFFVEDLKTLGLKNQRLHNMLLFFYAQWSEFADEKGWIIPGEETTVLDHAHALLDGYGAMLRYEAPYLCGNLLLSDAGSSLAKQYDYVFCDDFQNLSRAEQTCMCLCTRNQLLVCGNTVQTTNVNSDYPHPQGFERFERLRKNVDVFTLTEQYGIDQALQFGEALCDNKEEPSFPTQARADLDSHAAFLAWNTPENELNGTGNLVKALGETSPDINPCDTIIAVPNKRWGRLVQAALGNQALSTSAAGLFPRIEGNPRTRGRHDSLTAYIKLNLVAHPCDPIAWRAWTGLDDALTNSEIWKRIHAKAQEEGQSLYETLKSFVEHEAASASELPKLSALKDSWTSGQHVISSCSSLTGSELVDALGLRTLPVFEDVLRALTGTEDAPSLFKLVHKTLANPCFPEDKSLVHLALYENLCGLDYPCVIMPAMVDGMIPFRDAFDDAKSDEEQKVVLEKDRKRLYSCISKGTKFLFCSAFSQTDIETAERTKMKVARIISDKGKRVARLNRSIFFENAKVTADNFIQGADLNFEDFFKHNK